MLKVHVLDELYHHSSNVAHGVEVPAGARLVEARDRVMGEHKPSAIILIVKGLARPELKIEIEFVAAKVD